MVHTLVVEGCDSGMLCVVTTIDPRGDRPPASMRAMVQPYQPALPRRVMFALFAANVSGLVLMLKKHREKDMRRMVTKVLQVQVPLPVGCQTQAQIDGYESEVSAASTCEPEHEPRLETVCVRIRIGKAAWGPWQKFMQDQQERATSAILFRFRVRHVKVMKFGLRGRNACGLDLRRNYLMSQEGD